MAKITNSPTCGQSWLGKVKGHIGEAKGRFSADARQRAQAEKSPQSVILTDQMLRSGLDAGKVLFTTLNGGVTPITANELATFRHNMQLAKRQAGFKGAGITARQVIDLASAKPLRYLSRQPNGALSDLDKAKREITRAIPVSTRDDSVRFITNAGIESKSGRHHVTVQFTQFRNAVDSVVAAGNDPKAPRRAADMMRKAGLKFDCSCERHRYFLRYVATIGGFNAGRDETGFPKIRNPRLKGVACKHVLRVMAELESSGAVLSFLEQHLARQVSAYKGRMQTRQKDAEAALKAKKRPTRIKTSDERAAEAKRARDKRALTLAAKTVSAHSSKRVASATRRTTRAAAATLADQFGLSPEQVLTVLSQASQKG